MSIERLDHESFQLLKTLLNVDGTSSTTLAAVFRDKFSQDINHQKRILNHLHERQLIKVKYDDDDEVRLIEITQAGATYESRIQEEETQKHESVHAERVWQIRVLILSAIVSIICSLMTSYVSLKLMS